MFILDREHKQELRLRWAHLEDANGLVDLYNQARSVKEQRQEETLESMRAWLEHGGALLMESSRGEMLCALRWREEGLGWRVDRIATLPKARGKGYGRWLMTQVEALAIRTNIPNLTLSLTDVQDDLLKYYKRLGYGVLKQTPSTVVMDKRVGGTWQYKSPSL